MRFENVHRNKKLAFLDGFLCGALVMYFLRPFIKSLD